MSALACPVAGCDFADDFVGELGAHLMSAHDYERADAGAAARQCIQVPPPDTEAMMACGYCHRDDGSHTAGCKKPGGCKPCAHQAPKKCWRHGGELKGRPMRRPKPKRQAVNGYDDAKRLLLEKLDEQIADTRAELRALDRLRTTLA